MPILGPRCLLAALLLMGGAAHAVPAVQDSVSPAPVPVADPCDAKNAPVPSDEDAAAGAPSLPPPCPAAKPTLPSRSAAEQPIDTANARVEAEFASINAQLPKSDGSDPAQAGALFDKSAARAGGESLPVQASGAPAGAPAKVVEKARPQGQTAPLKPAAKPRHLPVHRTHVRLPSRRPAPAPTPVYSPFEQFIRSIIDGIANLFRGAATATTTAVHTVHHATVNTLRKTGDFVAHGAEEVKNRFFQGVEMVSGLGYKLIHAADRESNYGTTRLVVGVQRIAGSLRTSGTAQTELVIGDMSLEDGGKLGHHLSHRNGRDMDIGYFMVDEQGRPVQGTNLIPLDRGLHGIQGGRHVYFDAPRNWQLVRAFIATPDFRAEWIFVAPQIKTALLKEAVRENDPLREQANALLNTRWAGHNSHLHLRVQ